MATYGKGAERSMWFHYRFASPTNLVRGIRVELDPRTLGLLSNGRADYPEWVCLTHHQCTNCSLRPETHQRCPVAANLVDVVELFKDAMSCEQTDIEISTENRTYKKQAPLQDGLSALVGIYMVTSGCPILDMLRPLVRSHLPFATSEETTYRAIAMYWLAQYFRKRHGKEPDWELAGLSRIYEEIITVNRCFHQRIVDVHLGDAALNALFRLDCYAQFTNRILVRQNLGEIERFFSDYLRD